MKSEFGQGFIYNIVLFAKHFERFAQYRRRDKELKGKDYDSIMQNLWFDGAGDHFYEFEIPEQFKRTKVGKLAKELQEEALTRRLGNTTEKEFEAFFEKLEELCRLIDKKLGVKSKEAEWN